MTMTTTTTGHDEGPIVDSIVDSAHASSPPSPPFPPIAAVVAAGASSTVAGCTAEAELSTPTSAAGRAGLAAEAAPGHLEPALMESALSVDLVADLFPRETNVETTARDAELHPASRSKIVHCIRQLLRNYRLPISFISDPSLKGFADELSTGVPLPSEEEVLAASGSSSPSPPPSLEHTPRKRKAPTERDLDWPAFGESYVASDETDLSSQRKRSRSDHVETTTDCGGLVVELLVEPEPEPNTGNPSPQTPVKPTRAERTKKVLRNLTELGPVVLPLPADDEDLEVVRQSVVCQSQMWRDYPQCRSCVMRKTGDICRFLGVRVFTRRKGQSEYTYGPHFLPNREVSLDKFALIAAPDPASSFAVPASEQDDAENERQVRIGVDGRPHVISTLLNEIYVQEKTAAVCIEILDREIAHASRQPVYFWLPRTLWSKVKSSSSARQLCDECMTSIFCGYWFCGVCGKEICMDCFETALARSDGGDPNDAWRCAIGKCPLMKDHRPEPFIPVIKIPMAQLQLVRERAVKRLIGPPRPNIFVDDIPDYDFLSDTNSIVRIPPTTPPDEAERTFACHWSQGRPVLCSIDPSLIQADWSSKFFTEKFGEEVPKIVDCETKAECRITVSKFFAGFDNTALRPKFFRKRPVLKLPDWPTTMDFADKLPEHFKDYSRCLPFPRYTSRTGDRNLAARLPDINLPPDLGPKMYIAYGSTDAIGTTPLHMDMADAVNLMLHARAPSLHDLGECMADAPPGVAAVWDIFPAWASNKIREFLRRVTEERAAELAAAKKKPEPKICDPVHDQYFYLNAAMRRRLWTEYGVRGWRIMQKVGDAVFVPAGCAHQVRNYLSCVKIAADFVSPENLRECATLTSEFRTLARSHRRREDLLQLKSIMWSAWTSALEDPEKAAAAAAAAEAAAKAAAAADAAADAAAASAAPASPVDTLMAEANVEPAGQSKRKRPPPGSMADPLWTPQTPKKATKARGTSTAQKDRKVSAPPLQAPPPMPFAVPLLTTSLSTPLPPTSLPPFEADELPFEADKAALRQPPNKRGSGRGRGRGRGRHPSTGLTRGRKSSVAVATPAAVPPTWLPQTPLPPTALPASTHVPTVEEGKTLTRALGSESPVPTLKRLLSEESPAETASEGPAVGRAVRTLNGTAKTKKGVGPNCTKEPNTLDVPPATFGSEEGGLAIATQVEADASDYLPQAQRCYAMEGVVKCRSCVGKAPHDPCRFTNIRLHPVGDGQTPKFAASRHITPNSDDFSINSVKVPDPSTAINPSLFIQNLQADAKADDLTRSYIGPLMQQRLVRELDHASLPSACCWPISFSNITSRKCEECKIPILCGLWMCTLCARVQCLDCHTNLWAVPAASSRSTHKKLKSNFATCFFGSFKNDRRMHTKNDFLPVHRYPIDAIRAKLQELEKFVTASTWTEPPAPVGGKNEPLQPAWVERRGSGVPSLDGAALQTAGALARGVPVLSEVTSGDRILEKWSGSALLEALKDRTGQVLDCRTGGISEFSLHNFLLPFGANIVRCKTADDSPVILRVDLPLMKSGTRLIEEVNLPRHDEEFRRLVQFTDNSSVLGIPSLDGHLPSVCQPNKEPRMLLAYESTPDVGTIPLEIDPSDAVHLLAAAKIPIEETVRGGEEQTLAQVVGNNSGGRARKQPAVGVTFHVFPQSAVGKLRAFLEKITSERKGVPTYLNQEMIRRLEDEEGVFCWVVKLEVGQTLTIPAGSPYQMCANADVTMVSANFVSPQTLRFRPESALDCRLVPEPTIAEYAPRADAHVGPTSVAERWWCNKVG
ncbi:hypothetical protein DFJ73DRAFT_642620 [Zopfochytrium polystomum]|nr:hypothetical protein DFJ73DRAFT_642620 [Zopfochytrium polystomum]